MKRRLLQLGGRVSLGTYEGRVFRFTFLVKAMGDVTDVYYEKIPEKQNLDANVNEEFNRIYDAYLRSKQH